MTLEVLFAHAEQGQTFLRLMACGLLCGALLQGCLSLGRVCPRLTLMWDALAALFGAAAVMPAMLLSGEGVRAYGLLGLLIGAALWAAGPWYLTAEAARWIKKHAKARSQKKEDGENAGNI